MNVSKRVSWSRQLTMANDAETITHYSDPTFVLGGWTPQLAPILLTPLPGSFDLAVGGGAELTADAAAEPEAAYQWHKDGQPLAAQTSATLKLQDVTSTTAGEYSVSISNSVGTTMARTTVLVGTLSATTPTAGVPSTGGASGSSQAGAAGSVPPAANGGMAAQAQAQAQAGAQAPGRAATATPQAGDTPQAASAMPVGVGARAAANSGEGGGCSVGQAFEVSEAWSWLLLAAWMGWRRKTT